MSAHAQATKTATPIYTTRTTCRLCGSTDLPRVWSFGETPLANSYLTEDELDQAEPTAPLNVHYCQDCSLVQLIDVVDPKLLFQHYLYVSSTSPKFVAHFEDYAAMLIDRFNLTSDDLVIDVGSNDGVLLKPFKAAGVKVLGIDPAENIAALANAQGIETLPAFFTEHTAEQVVKKYRTAKVVSANNVFAHADDIIGFTHAVKKALAPDGVFVFEVQYLADLINNNLFDIVYHEHTCYYSVHPLIEFFPKHGLAVFDVEKIPTHGGSIRVFVQHQNGPHQRSRRLDDILQEEQAAGLTTIKPYQQFAARISSNKEKLHRLIMDIKSKGQRIVGYGAPAKATTLMYAFNLDAHHLDYIVDDDTKFKQGRYMPGTHIPIVSPDYLYGEGAASAHPSRRAVARGYGLQSKATGWRGKASAPKADYCLILAWNFAEPIMQNHQRFIEQGGKFIVPVPEPRVV